MPRKQRHDIGGDLSRIERFGARVIGQQRAEMSVQREHTVGRAREILLRPFHRSGAVEAQRVAHAIERGGEVRELVQHAAHHQRDHRRFGRLDRARTQGLVHRLVRRHEDAPPVTFRGRRPILGMSAALPRRVRRHFP
ncbi:MAG: hypothetical protein IT357_00285 [Gemmatimonadaceae bacterium]|nr:hypothetical protein [Gemmatimonadaceae bacterium]